MFNFNLHDKNIKKIHFIGIGGVSMSGIAELLKFQVAVGSELIIPDRKL